MRRFDDYVASLEKAKVMLDAERRKDVILHDARDLAFANGLDLVEDEGLLEEVSGLVEWPHVLMGTFEEDYLAIPAEIIRLTIKTNQKCFVTRPAGRKRKPLQPLHPRLEHRGKRRRQGDHAWQRQGGARARLSDAKHFFTRDQGNLPDLETLQASAQKFGLDLRKPLDQRMAKLDALNVTFHAKLGTQGERVTRIKALARQIAPVVGADEALVDRAVVLAKADLRTEAVGEFPELQGLMGRKYAVLQGENPSVAAAIEDHYKPQGPSDRVPDDKVAITVALADKLDTLVGFWAIDEKPTGSKDPYALRRAALGVVRIILERKVRLGLLTVFKDADLLSFFHDRLKVYLRDMGARHDIIDAVLTPDADDLLLIARRAEALTAFITSEDGKNLLAGTKRATQLLAAEEKKGTVVADGVSETLLTLDAEKALYSAIKVGHLRARPPQSPRKTSARPWEALSEMRGSGGFLLRSCSRQRRGLAIRAKPPGPPESDPRATRTVAGFLEDCRLTLPDPHRRGLFYPSLPAPTPDIYDRL